MTVVQMSSELEQRAPTGSLIAKVRGDDFTRQQISMALPATVSLDRFTRATITALMQNPDLAKADEASLFQAVVRCAQDGLLPDGREAALVVYGGKAQYLPMIAGVRKIAGEYGWTIQTHVIYEHDQWEVDLGGGLPIHRPAPLGQERGRMVGAWARATHRDGRDPVIEVMRGEDIEKHRQVSRAKDRGPWKDWTAQMWEKTVGHRIAKKLPLDPVDQQRLNRVIDATELEPGQAAEMLYGPQPGAASFSELSAGTEYTDPEDPSGQPPDGTADGGGQATADSPPLAEPAPAATPAEHSAEAVSDDERMLADDAASYVPPRGIYSTEGDKGPLTLRQIHEIPDGEGIKYIRMLVRRLGENEAEWRAQVEAYCTVYLPEALTQAA